MILVVEDDPSILELLSVALEEQGYEVELCADGQNVLEVARAESPALILLDLWIPGINGEEVTKLLKADDQTRHIPVVIVSAQNDLPSVATRIGADGFLPKPFDLDNLFLLVQKLILKF